MTSVQTALEQVMTRLAESLDSPVAELPTGDGPADSPAITGEDQVILFLDEGQKILARTPMLEIRGSATKTGVAASDRRFEYTDVTSIDPTDRSLWHIESAAWTPENGTAVALEVNDGRYYTIHHPAPLTETASRPRRIYNAGRYFLLGPKPATDGALEIEGLLLPKTLASGGDIEDVPDEKVHHIVAFACWRICQQNLAEPAFAAALGAWQAEISWAAPILGLGTGV